MSSDSFPSEEEKIVLRELVDALAEEMPLAEAVEMMGKFGYFRAKAGIYFRKGADAYRRDDFFHVPREEWSPQELAAMEQGLRQIADWKGLTPDTALTEIDLGVLYRMIELTHFQLEHLSARLLNDGEVVHVAMLRHRMENSPLRLCYKTSERSAGVAGDLAMVARGGIGTGRFQARRDAYPETYGYTPEHPILCFDPFGERMFLAKLRCPNGHRFSAQRIGSLSGACPDLESHQWPFEDADASSRACPVDKYKLECHGGEHTCHLYFDMYHSGFLLEPAPRGLSIAPPEDES